MDRRTALKQLTAAGVGLTMLQACNFSEDRLPMALKNLNVTIPQEDLLKLIVDAILPADAAENGLPGALDLEADKFVWVMADDCLSEEDQGTFMNGLNGFEACLKEVTGQDFEETKPENRAAALSAVMNSEITSVPSGPDDEPRFSPDDVRGFIGIVKGWTLTGYMQSEYIMSEVMPYTLVPRFYNGCVDINPSEKININA